MPTFFAGTSHRARIPVVVPIAGTPFWVFIKMKDKEGKNLILDNWAGPFISTGDWQTVELPGVGIITPPYDYSPLTYAVSYSLFEAVDMNSPYSARNIWLFDRQDEDITLVPDWQLHGYYNNSGLVITFTNGNVPPGETAVFYFTADFLQPFTVNEGILASTSFLITARGASITRTIPWAVYPTTSVYQQALSGGYITASTPIKLDSVNGVFIQKVINNMAYRLYKLGPPLPIYFQRG